MPQFRAIRRFRERLAAGEKLLGSGVTLSDPSITEALAGAVDFVWIDMEHSHLTLERTLGHLVAAQAGGVPALVRVPVGDAAHLKPLLDIGAPGVIAPQISGAAEARAIVEICRYAPAGRRGFGPRRAGDYGRRANDPAALVEANRTVFVAVQIENEQALAEIDQIVALPGLDSVALGPYDLSLALGHPGEIRHPRVWAALKHVVERARTAGKFVGSGLGPVPDLARDLLDLGVDWLQVGDDYGHMLAGVTSLFHAIRPPVTK